MTSLSQWRQRGARSMKNAIKAIAGRFGVEFHRTARGRGANGTRPRQYPYIESFAMNDIRFDYWITDDTYRAWYEPAAQAAWCVNEGYVRLLAKSDRVLEVGCNAGFTTCLLSRVVGPDGLVVGLDIIPSNCLIASAQIGLNGMTNARVLNRGAADSNGKIRVNNWNNGSVQQRESSGGIEVEITRCDELIKDYGFFDVVKVDVEGFESRVFKGAQELMSKHPRLLLEVHGAEVENYGSSYDELFRLIDIDRYEGLMHLEHDGSTGTNQLERFDLERVLATRAHGNLFLRPKA